MADHSAHCRLSGYPGVVSGERAAGKRVRSYIQRTIMALFFSSHFEFKKCLTHAWRLLFSHTV